MPSNWIENQKSSHLVQLATYISVGIAGILIIIKFGAWVATSSISLQATLFDSILDAAASLINLFAVREALRPADKEHRFGHGKIEALAALGQSAFIAGSAAFLSFEALRRFYEPETIQHTHIGIGVMVISIILTLSLVLFQRYVVRVTRSAAIKADATHYKADLMVNAGVILALISAEWFHWYLIDTLLGFAIAGYIVYTAWEIASEAFHILIDRELPNEQRTHIRELALSHPQVKGIHDLRTRSAGLQSFVQLHLEMDGAMSLSAAHLVTDEVMHLITNAYPEAEVIIHQDIYQGE
jgi:ferrous-iron efflux pump FieF